MFFKGPAIGAAGVTAPIGASRASRPLPSGTEQQADQGDGGWCQGGRFRNGHAAVGDCDVEDPEVRHAGPGDHRRFQPVAAGRPTEAGSVGDNRFGVRIQSRRDSGGSFRFFAACEWPGSGYLKLGRGANKRP
jgi:hypothetical protein